MVGNTEQILCCWLACLLQILEGRGASQNLCVNEYFPLLSTYPLFPQQPFPDALCLLAVTAQVGLMGTGMVCVPQEETNYTLIDSAHGDSISGTSTVETVTPQGHPQPTAQAASS